MDPDTERFIELVSRPLAGNAELALATREELGRLIEENAEGRPGPVHEAVAILEDADTHPNRRYWKVWLYLIALFVSLPLIVQEVRKISVSPGAVGGKLPVSLSSVPPQTFSYLSPPQKLLLNGDTRSPTRSGRWKPLWQSDPKNPAFLAEYAAAWFDDSKSLSPEILAAAEQVDPDNGWFPAFAAAAKAKGVVTREKRTEQEKSTGKAPVLTVTDEARLKESLALLHEIAAKPRFTSYQAKLLGERISLLPPRRDFRSSIPLMACAADVIDPGISFREFSDVLAAGAQECAQRRDVAGFQSIVNDWRALATTMIKGGDTMVDLLVAKIVMAGPAANFRDSARLLGLEKDADYFDGLDKRRMADEEARKLREQAIEAETEIWRRKTSIYGGFAGPGLKAQVRSAPVVTDDDRRPAMYADHAMLGQAFSGMGWLLLGGCAVMAGVLRLRSRKIRGLSLRLVGLVRPMDWVVLVAGGAVFPVLWYLMITRLTPLSAREWTMTLMDFIPAGGQFLSFFLSLVILPVVMARALLARRGAVLGWAARSPWLGGLAGFMVLAAVPAFGAIPLGGDYGPLMWVAVSCLVCAVVAWVASGLNRGPLLSRELQRATSGRMYLPIWILGMVMLALSIRVQYAEEQHWIQRDHVGEISAEAPALSRYEYKVIQVLRSETLEMLGSPPLGH